MIKARNLFNLIFLVFLFILIILSFEYNPKARLIPLTVGIITFIMLLLQYLGDQFPSMGKRLRFIRQGGILDTEETSETADNKEDSVDEGSDSTDKWSTAFITIICLLAFTLIMHYTSYLIAVPIFIFLFTWLYGKAKMKSSLVIAIGMFGFMYVLFDLILQARI